MPQSQLNNLDKRGFGESGKHIRVVFTTPSGLFTMGLLADT